jgi:rubredoxin
MGFEEISGDDLDAYLSCPDCPVCGSDNVTCTQSYPDGLGNIVHVYLCNKCGHVWSEATPA